MDNFYTDYAVLTNSVILRHEYGIATYSHRICAYRGEIQIAAGDWAAYSEIATLQFGGETYIAATNYYAKKLPIERICRLENVSISRCG